MKNLMACFVVLMGISCVSYSAEMGCIGINDRRAELVRETWDSIKSEVTLDKMEKLYDPNVELVDFQYSDKGLQKLVDYWETTRSKHELAYVRFDSAEAKGNFLFVRWTIMIVSKANDAFPSKKLMSKGISEMRFHPCSLKAYFERDYLDPLKVVTDF
ncbi:MAG: hypothetical protein V4736_11280 [Bdellovibrionota bacterium]